MPNKKIISFQEMIDYYRSTEKPEYNFWGKFNKVTGDFEVSPTVAQNDFNIKIYITSKPEEESFGFYFSIWPDNMKLYGSVFTGTNTLSASDEAIIARFTASYKSHEQALLQAKTRCQEELKIKEKTAQYLGILFSYLKGAHLPHLQPLIKRELNEIERTRDVKIVDLCHFLKNTTEKSVRENTNTPIVIALFEEHLRQQPLEEKRTTVSLHLPPANAINSYSFHRNPQLVPIRTVEVKEEEPPNEFICPISLEIMKDPVIVVGSGQTYERNSIKAHFSTRHTDPVSGVALNSAEKILVSNIALKKLINDWLKAHPRKPQDNAQGQTPNFR